MRSDVYAFGVLLWSLYSGQQPYVWQGGGWVPNFHFPHFKSYSSSRRTVSVCAHYKHLAERCLQAEPHLRPTFREVKNTLSLILGSHEPYDTFPASTGMPQVDLATLAKSRLQRARTNPALPGHRAAAVATSAGDLEVRAATWAPAPAGDLEVMAATWAPAPAGDLEVRAEGGSEGKEEKGDRVSTNFSTSRRLLASCLPRSQEKLAMTSSIQPESLSILIGLSRLDGEGPTFLH